MDITLANSSRMLAVFMFLGLPFLFFPQNCLANFMVLHGLAMERVQLDIDTITSEIAPDEERRITFERRLSQRARQMLADKGLRLGPYSSQVKKGHARLTITIWAINLEQEGGIAETLMGGTSLPGRGTWLFNSKIELWAWTYSRRNPDIAIFSPIWARSRKLPVVRETISLDDVENEFVEMLESFISDYQWANPPSSTSD